MVLLDEDGKLAIDLDGIIAARIDLDGMVMRADAATKAGSTLPGTRPSKPGVSRCHRAHAPEHPARAVWTSRVVA